MLEWVCVGNYLSGLLSLYWLFIEKGIFIMVDFGRKE